MKKAHPNAGKAPAWPAWLGLSAALHGLAALAMAAVGPESLEVRIDPAQQQLPLRARFVSPAPAPEPRTPPSPQPQSPLVSTLDPQAPPAPDLPETQPPVEPAPAEPVPSSESSAEPTPAKSVPPEAPPEPAPEATKQPTEPVPHRNRPVAAASRMQQEERTGAQLRESGPAAVHNPAPAYPRIAVARNWTGTVWLEVCLEPTGKPRRCRILQSSGHNLLDRKARQTVLRKWRFAANPKKHRRKATIAVAFSLR